jgi:hypothetical protein
MTEKRAAPRYKVFKRGALAFGGGGGIDCTVRNLSANGARVDIAGPLSLPSSLTLVIEADQFMRRCHLVWTNDKQFGLAFD